MNNPQTTTALELCRKRVEELKKERNQFAFTAFILMLINLILILNGLRHG